MPAFFDAYRAARLTFNKITNQLVRPGRDVYTIWRTTRLKTGCEIYCLAPDVKCKFLQADYSGHHWSAMHSNSDLPAGVRAGKRFNRFNHFQGSHHNIHRMRRLAIWQSANEHIRIADSFELFKAIAPHNFVESGEISVQPSD